MVIWRNCEAKRDLYKDAESFIFTCLFKEKIQVRSQGYRPH